MIATVTREQVLEAVKILGLHPNTILELHIFPTYATGEEIVTNLSGDDVKMGKVTLESDRVPRRTFHVRVKGDA